MRSSDIQVDSNHILKLLRKVRDPQFEESIVDLGLISRIEIHEGVAIISVNFNRSLPSCKSCVPMAWMVLRAILREMERVLKKEGIRYRIIENDSDILYAEG